METYDTIITIQTTILLEIALIAVILRSKVGKNEHREKSSEPDFGNQFQPAN